MYRQKQGYYKGTEIVKWFKEFNNDELVRHERYNKLGNRIYMWVNDGNNKSHTQIERKYKNHLLVKLYKNNKLIDYYVFNLSDGSEVFNDIIHKNLINEMLLNESHVFKYNSLIAHRFFMYKFEFMFKKYLNQLTDIEMVKIKLLAGSVLIGIMNNFENDLNIRKIKSYGKDIVIKAIKYFKDKLDFEYSKFDDITINFINTYQISEI